MFSKDFDKLQCTFSGSFTRNLSILLLMLLICEQIDSDNYLYTFMFENYK